MNLNIQSIASIPYSKLKPMPFCNICGKLPAETKTKRLVIDHNHKTKFIRGWLCDFCNAQLGVLESCKDRSIFIIEARFSATYQNWMNAFKTRIFEHATSATKFLYCDRWEYRKLYSSAFASTKKWAS